MTHKTPIDAATFTWLGLLRPVLLGPVAGSPPEFVPQPVSTGFRPAPATTGHRLFRRKHWPADTEARTEVRDCFETSKESPAGTKPVPSPPWLASASPSLISTLGLSSVDPAEPAAVARSAGENADLRKALHRSFTAGREPPRTTKPLRLKDRYDYARVKP